MATDVISNLAGSLDAELEKAKETLKNVDDDIKKVFGKDASEMFGRGRGDGGGAYNQNDNFHGRIRRREDERDSEEPHDKRRRESLSRLGPPLRFSGGGRREEEESGPRRLASRVVSSGKEKSREEVLAEQRSDRNGRERNRRMFGALLGTLQRFKQDETKLKDKEEKRAQIEAKLDEAAKKEREVVKTKKQELIKERRVKLTEIKRIEVKRRRLTELEQWEEKTKFLTNFIRTEAKPHIFYLPKVLNPITECRLEQSKQHVTEMISHKRKLVLEDLEDYEERSKRYWENRMAGKSFKKIDPLDADIEDELDEIMKHERELGGEVEDFTVTVYNEEENGEGSNGFKLEVEEKENVGLVERGAGIGVKVESEETEISQEGTDVEIKEEIEEAERENFTVTVAVSQDDVYEGDAIEEGMEVEMKEDA